MCAIIALSCPCRAESQRLGVGEGPIHHSDVHAGRAQGLGVQLHLRIVHTGDTDRGDELYLLQVRGPVVMVDEKKSGGAQGGQQAARNLIARARQNNILGPLCALDHCPVNEDAPFLVTHRRHQVVRGVRRQ